MEQAPKRLNFGEVSEPASLDLGSLRGYGERATGQVLYVNDIPLSKI